MRQATVYIDRQALQYNLNRCQTTRSKFKNRKHGKGQCIRTWSQRLFSSLKCLRCLWCSLPTRRRLEIRELGFEQPVTLIEGVFSEDEMPVAIEQKFECVIHHQQQFEWLIKHKQAYIAQGLKVWVKLNSGMNRLGF